MTGRKKVLITKERSVHTYAELWHASGCMLAVGQGTAVGSAWQFLSSALLTAFSVEAYLNHVALKIDPAWSSTERMSPMEKLQHLSLLLRADFPYGRSRRPLQTMKQLFDFRNMLAHGKTETIASRPIKRDISSNIDDYLKQRPLTKWEQLISTDAFAIRARDDAKLVFEKLHEQRPEPKEPLLGFGIGLHSASIQQ